MKGKKVYLIGFIFFTLGIVIMFILSKFIIFKKKNLNNFKNDKMSQQQLKTTINHNITTQQLNLKNDHSENKNKHVNFTNWLTNEVKISNNKILPWNYNNNIVNKIDLSAKKYINCNQNQKVCEEKCISKQQKCNDHI